MAQEDLCMTNKTLDSMVGESGFSKWAETETHIADVRARVEALEAWQDRQNGSIQRIESKVDKMIYLHFGELFAILATALGVLFKR